LTVPKKAWLAAAMFGPTRAGSSNPYSYGTLPLPVSLACPDLNSGSRPRQCTLLLALVWSSGPLRRHLSAKPFVCNDRGPLGGTRRIGFVKKPTMKARSHQTLVHDLRELVAALDRRVPRVEREGTVGQETA
jgi:hypothetical protein